MAGPRGISCGAFAISDVLTFGNRRARMCLLMGGRYVGVIKWILDRLGLSE